MAKTTAGLKTTHHTLTKADYETLAEFRYSLRQFLHFSEKAADTVGFSPQQHQALLAIKGFPGRDWVAVGELAERLHVRHHSAVGLVDRLVRDGLVKRKAADDDGRKVIITVTARGLRMLEKLSATHKDELRRVGRTFRTVFDQLMKKEETESV